MDASRYFDAMHNAMSTQHVGAQLLLTVRLQDTCGNDAYLEVKQLPGEQSALVCYSTMGRRCLNFQLFRKGWQLCHNADGQLTGRFPSSADSLLSQTDFRAYCREDRLNAARTQRLIEELGQRAGTNYVGIIPQNARTGAQITVESHLGRGARWSYWSQDASPCLPLAAILYWLADFLARLHSAPAPPRCLPHAARAGKAFWPPWLRCKLVPFQSGLHIKDECSTKPSTRLFCRVIAKKHPASRFRSAGCSVLKSYGSAYATQPTGEITPRCSRTAGTSSRRGCAKCPSERGSAASSRCSKRWAGSRYPP